MNLAILSWSDGSAEAIDTYYINEEDENDAIFAAMMLVRQQIADGNRRITILNSTETVAIEE